MSETEKKLRTFWAGALGGTPEQRAAAFAMLPADVIPKPPTDITEAEAIAVIDLAAPGDSEVKRCSRSCLRGLYQIKVARGATRIEACEETILEFLDILREGKGIAEKAREGLVPPADADIKPVPCTSCGSFAAAPGSTLCEGCSAAHAGGEPVASAYAARATTECAYCSRDVADDTAVAPPALDDDASWADLAREHAPDCEWILTRAHRLEAK